MARFVLANLRAGKFQDGLKRRSRAAASDAWDRLSGDADIVGDYDPADELARRVVVFEADPDMVAALPQDRDVVVEPEVLRWPLRAPLPPDVQTDPDDSGPLGVAALTATAPFTAKLITSGSRPVANVDCQLVATVNDTRRGYQARTDTSGVATFTIPSGAKPYALVIEPYEAFYPVVAYGAVSGMTVMLPALPTTTLAWQATAVGEVRYQYNVGSGIVVGVADTGFGPHPALGGVHEAGAFINGRVDTSVGAARDVDLHGSHVSGTIAGRGRPGGIAPGCELWVARVFPDAEQGASTADIVNAVDNLSRTHRADLINLSLGSPQGSRAEHDAVVDAAERGTLVVCAAGNDGGPVGYPAFYDEAAAVSALGRDGAMPASSLSALRRPKDLSAVGAGGYWLADFSDRGVQVDVAAPGVGVVATVPVRAGSSSAPFTALDGTSMASPAAVAALAVLLSRSAAYRRMPRDRSRTEQARRVLAAHAASVGLAQPLQGAGLPRVV